LTRHTIIKTDGRAAEGDVDGIMERPPATDERGREKWCGHIDNHQTLMS
jgi:hypothetical protein